MEQVKGLQTKLRATARQRRTVPCPHVRGRAVYTALMKSIGPYVISAVPHGALVQASGPGAAVDAPPSRPATAPRAPAARPDAVPMHGVDRLTGMPVLLHRLPEFVVPASVPDSGSLLPVAEVDVWDGHPYAITELPLSAVPATHAGSAALGALRALTALHAAGQVHGGINAGQLWQVGREVRLAGAGLPWRPGAGPAGDLIALGQTLDTLGPRPAVLKGLETMSAGQALALLESALRGREPEEAPPSREVTPPAVAPAPVVVSVPPVPEEAEPVPVRSVEPAPDSPVEAAPDSVVETAPLPADPPLAEAAPTLPGPKETEGAPVSYRTAEDIIVIGDADTASALGSEAPAPPTERLIPAPIRIGFGDDAEPLPELPPTEVVPKPSARITAEATASSPPRPSTAPRPDTMPNATPSSGRPVSTGSANASSGARGQPLRIGWEEDHSWRVVKSGPEQRTTQAPRLPVWALALAVLLVLGGLGFWYFGQTGTPAAACCTVNFTVTGSNQPVKVTLVQAPPNSPLQPGALIGTAPGDLKFPGAPGRYLLKFTSEGHGALTGAVTVPSGKPFGIVLK